MGSTTRRKVIFSIPSAMQFWLLAIVITLSCCSCAQTRHVPETPIAPDISKAIDETQTEFHEKLFYVKGAETPFSGDTIRYYSSRQPESFCHWLNGNLHGISTDWHENGIIKEQCNWSYGEPSGAFSQWDEQGRLSLRKLDNRRMANLRYIASAYRNYAVKSEYKQISVYIPSL